MKVNPVKVRSELFLKSLTQSEAAKRASLSRSTVAAACTGGRIAKESAEKLAEALNVELEKLME